MRKVLGILSSLALISGAAGMAAAADGESMSVGGTFYYDYFMNLTEGADEGTDATSGFEFRRVYLTVKKGWGDMSFRYTADLDYNSGTGNLAVFSKYAYLEHRGLVPNASVLVGQHSPNTLAWVEKRWAYRSVAKTMSDENKWSHSSQFGVGLQGKGMSGKLEYSLDVNNGNGYKSTVAKDGRGFSARVAGRPAGGFWVSGLASGDAPGGTFVDSPDTPAETVVNLDSFDTYFEGFAGWEIDRGAAFVQVGRFRDAQWTGGGLNASAGLDERTSLGISSFGRARLMDGLNALGRVDRVDPNTDLDSDRFQFFVAGLDYRIHEGFFLQPNLQVKTFEADGTKAERAFVLTCYGEI